MMVSNHCYGYLLILYSTHEWGILLYLSFLILFQTPLGIIFKNENVNEDMLAILQQFHSYLPQTKDGCIDNQLFSGDQLTVERAVNVITSVGNGLTPQDRLDGINLQLGHWHAAVKLLSVSDDPNNGCEGD